MSAVRAAESARSRRVHDFRAAGHGSNGHAAAQRFRHGDQIRFDAEMLGSEPFAGACESRLHFVRNEEDAVLAANILEKLEVIAWGNDETAFAENGFDDQSGNGFRGDGALEGVFEMMRKFSSGGARRIAIRVCKRNAVDIASKRLKACFVRMRLAGQRHGEKRAPMESIFETDYCGAFCIGAG